MNKLVIVSYLNFLSLKDSSRKILSENEDFFVSISKEEYVKLSSEDKNKLVGVALTDEKYNAKIIDTIKRDDIQPRNVKFYLKEIKTDVEVKVLEQSYKEKHLKYSKPYCPKNIINKNYNSKKRGGR